MILLYLCAALLLTPAASWWTLPAMRTLLPEGKPVGYWRAEGNEPEAAFVAVHVTGEGVRAAVLLGPGKKFLFDGEHASGPFERGVDSIDVDGGISGGWAVVFYADQRMARSALSFDTGEGGENLRILVAGLAPGTWEIWRNGWLVDIDGAVKPEESVLRFNGRPGSYFLRRLN